MSEPIVFLKGERVHLRPLEEADATDAARWMNDPDTRAWLGSCLPISVANEVQWIGSHGVQRPPVSIQFGIVESEGDRLVGAVGIHEIDWVARTGVLGMVIAHSDLRGVGVGTEAGKLVLNYVFGELNLRALLAEAIEPNSASRALQKKLGAKEIGRKPDWVFRGGQYHDMVMSVLTREVWLASQK